MMTQAAKSEPADRRVSRMPSMIDEAIAVAAGWCTGMSAAYFVIVANAKIGSGPLAHPVATWFVGVRSAVLAIVLAIIIRLFLRQSKKRLLLGAVLGMAAPVGTLFWLYR
jgi:hypothetical protein